MSTYLVAFVICDFELIHKQTDTNITIRYSVADRFVICDFELISKQTHTNITIRYTVAVRFFICDLELINKQTDTKSASGKQLQKEYTINDALDFEEGQILYYL